MKRPAVMALGALLVCCGSASALNPSLDVSQYAHTSWKIRDGFPGGQVNSIAQTPDGYLWLGTEYGLVRFDGVRHSEWQAPAGPQLPSNYIRKLIVTRDGALWIGTTNGLASWKDGRLTLYQELDGMFCDALLEDRAGSVWVGGRSYRPASDGKLCEIRSGHAQCFGKSENAGFAFMDLYQSRNGTVWGGVPGGLLRWSAGPQMFYPLRGEVDGIQAFVEEENGAMLIGGRSGIRRFADGRFEPYSLPGVRGKFTAFTMLRDRDGGLWVGTNGQGLLHVHNGRTDTFAPSGGLSSDRVGHFFEDREGDVWVATFGGLDRFRDYAVATFSGSQGLSYSVGAVAADRDGALWIQTDEGLKRRTRDRVTAWRERGTRAANEPMSPAIQTRVAEVAGAGFPYVGVGSLFRDGSGRIWITALGGVGYRESDGFTRIDGLPGGIVHALAQDKAGNLWIANQNLGLFRRSPGHGIQLFSWSDLGSYGDAISIVGDPRGGVWLGFNQGGISWFRDGRIQASYSTADGLGRGRVTHLRFDSAGALWAATEGGLSRLKDGQVITLSEKKGLPCDTVHWSMEDHLHSWWLYMPCGLVRIDRTEMYAWAAAPNRSVHVRVFDGSDGVRTVAMAGGYAPPVSETPDGRLWFTALDGLSVIDPAHVAFNKLPPPVHIEQITADHRVYGASPGRRLPPPARDLEIDYTALSLVAPEKDRFKYKLEGYDSGWCDAGNRRQAFYTNLPPRNYRFRVQASNNDGVWNEAGASIDLFIDPAYYQTDWFKAVCLAAFLALLWGLYRYRQHQIAHEFNTRIEERVGERTRIARDLHDTLLQSFQGVLIKLDAVTYLIRSRPDEAEKVLDGLIGQAQAAIVEGREAVHDLRTSTKLTSDLAQAIKDAGDELASTGGAAFRMLIEGSSRELRPITRDEIYRIAREALRNAFHHAKAQRIEAELTYSDRSLRLRIRDDGGGIPQAVLKGDGEGHFGLAGMRERAAQIGAKLNIWSRAGSGTEVDLSVPASTAYTAIMGGSRPNLFRRKAG